MGSVSLHGVLGSLGSASGVACSPAPPPPLQVVRRIELAEDARVLGWNARLGSLVTGAHTLAAVDLQRLDVDRLRMNLEVRGRGATL